MTSLRGRIGSHDTLVALTLALAFLILAWPRSVSAQAGAGWQQRWERVLAEAKKEGKVVVLGPPGRLLREQLVGGFRKAFPEISIEYLGARGGKHATRLRAERDGGIYSADVMLSGTTTANVRMRPMGALDPIRPVLLLPQVANPQNWRNHRLEFSDKEGRYNLVFINQVLPLVDYNLSQVRPQEIDELYELLDPKWKGKIVINDPLPPGPGNVAFRFLWRALGPKKATEFFRRIRAQAAAVDRDQRRQIEWVARGKYPILLAPSSPVGEQLRKRGLKFGILPQSRDYGGYLSATFGSAMLVNRAPHASAATVFINWVLTREGQTAWSKATNAPSLRLDVPTDHLAPYLIPEAGTKYWISHLEENVRRTPEEEKILGELFGR